jgi:hypothetical protein
MIKNIDNNLIGPMNAEKEKLVILRSYRVRSQNTELTRGPTELVQHFRL